MVGMVANLNNYDEEELRALEQAINTRRDELSDDVPPSEKEILHFVHDLILDSDPKGEGYAAMGIYVRSVCCLSERGTAEFETQSGHKFEIKVHNLD
jgi:hypothetical protein